MYIKRIAIVIVAAILMMDVAYTASKLVLSSYSRSATIPSWQVKVLSPYQGIELFMLGLVFICGMAYLVSRFVKTKTKS